MDSTTSSAPSTAKKAPSRPGFPWNRTIHRIGAFLAALLMAWLATTGSLMQLLDFKALLTHAPATDPTALSMAEGMYGPPDFAVIQLADFKAAPLPSGLDIDRAIDTVLQAERVAAGVGIDPLHPLAWVELRVADGVPIGQLMMGTRLDAFNALTGSPVAAVAPQSFPQGGRLPPSLRQKLKILHRFWNRHDTPGVYFEFLAGLILSLLLVTGLVMYFRLLGARARIGRRQLFWLSGGLWRGLHRSVSVVAAVFLVSQAFTGTWIGFESSVNALRRSGSQPAAVAVATSARPGQRPQAGVTAAAAQNPVDFIVPLRDDEVMAMTTTTVDAMRRLHPGTPIKAIRLRIYGRMKQGVVITGGNSTGQRVFNAATGQPVGLSDLSYPQSGFPFGVQVHEDIKHFHSGAMFGIPTRLMNLFAGLSLLFLAVSGLVMYFDLWSKRRKAGRGGLLWR